MVSTISFDIVGNPREYPDWYGIPDIGFIWHNEWSDPQLEYKSKLYNSIVIEGTMWGRLTEECDSYDTEIFAQYMKENANEVYELLELLEELSN